MPSIIKINSATAASPRSIYPIISVAFIAILAKNRSEIAFSGQLNEKSIHQKLPKSNLQEFKKPNNTDELLKNDDIISKIRKRQQYINVNWNGI